jgi:hypothetical protein
VRQQARRRRKEVMVAKRENENERECQEQKNPKDPLKKKIKNLFWLSGGRGT